MGSQNILDKVDEMPLEEQAMLVELIRNRYKEKRREEILANARQTLEEYNKGLSSKGTVSDLLRERLPHNIPDIASRAGSDRIISALLRP